MIPKFHRVTKKPEDTKLLPPRLGGVLREEEKLNKANEVTTEDHAQFDMVGYYHTPKQFLSMAKQTMHPMDATVHLEEPNLLWTVTCSTHRSVPTAVGAGGA